MKTLIILTIAFILSQASAFAKSAELGLSASVPANVTWTIVGGLVSNSESAVTVEAGADLVVITVE